MDLFASRCDFGIADMVWCRNSKAATEPTTVSQFPIVNHLTNKMVS